MSLEGVIKAGVSPITKVIDVIAKGCGKLYEPKHLKKMYKARAEGIQLLSETIKNCTPELVYNDGISKIDNIDIANRAKSRLAYQELIKQKNIEDVIGLTYNEVKDIKSVDEKPLEENWIVRFFNTVQDVSNEDLQKIWAKLLAGEIKKPGSVSLRTMEHLKNLTSEEAQIFTNIAKYALFSTEGKAFLYDDIIDEDDLFYGYLIILDDCGLIKSDLLELVFFKDERIEQDFIYNSRKKMNLMLEDSKKFSLKIFNFTTSGTELIKLLNIESNEKAYEYVKQQTKMFGVSITEEDIEKV